ncbi:type 2 lanthipeptide synthetase LanM family protein [Longispora albida]|uniref:type 2 lanthipeptide synthetase LanM family protein n=1 Tax=Longispora albida TaxID=203523 RepID=UPI00036A6BF7|nr:type 2 lanthipeptide synthetase LanM family protein [Longispora albida]
MAWAAWARGLSLAERRALPGPVLPDPAEETRSRLRLNRWARIAGAGQGPEAEVLALFAEPAGALAARAPQPRWAADLTRILSSDPAPPPAGSGWRAGFQAVLWPFVADAATQVTPGTPPGLLPGFTRALSGQLTRIAARTLVLELQVLRVTGQLSGASSADRFASFIRYLSQPGALAALLGEYPVLGRLLTQAAARSAAAQNELMARLAADRPAIVDTLLGGRDPGPLTAVAAHGDPHRGGRTVAVLTFASGERVVYKPRPLDVQYHFGTLLGWLSERLPGLDLLRPGVLAREGYGWAGYVRHRPCRSGAARYYHRVGVLLALVHLLEGVDFHLENVIACADQPVLVDLEGLFHPPHHPGDPLGTVRRTGLLPEYLRGDGGALDISGLGGSGGGRLPVKSAVVAGAGTDEMRIVRAHLTAAGAQNQPVVRGRAADPRAHAGAVVEGFRAGYDLISAERAHFAGLLEAFAEAETRVVLRPTRVYTELLDESTHPDVLRDALDRDGVLAHLRAAPDGFRDPMVPYELAELWAGDVPMFTTRPGSRDLTAAGCALPAVYPVSSLDRVRQKVAACHPGDRRVQENLITSSLTQGGYDERR